MLRTSVAFFPSDEPPTIQHPPDPQHEVLVPFNQLMSDRTAVAMTYHRVSGEAVGSSVVLRGEGRVLDEGWPATRPRGASSWSGGR
jgi:hypothetical protein